MRRRCDVLALFAEGGRGGCTDVRDVSTRRIRRLYHDIHGRLRHDTAASHHHAPYNQLSRGLLA